MKHLIILGDGMADWPVPALGDKTLLQYADTPAMDWLARNGRVGLLKTVPDGFHPGSEVANSSILGYDQHLVYEGRGPLEAASIGVELQPDDLALRCNLVCIEGDNLKNHSCGRLETEEGDVLIRFLNQHLATDRIRFYTGVQYRHLLVIKGGNKYLKCTPPHDIPLHPWRPALPSAASAPASPASASSAPTSPASAFSVPASPVSASSAPTSPASASSPLPPSSGSVLGGFPAESPLPPLSAEETAALLRHLILRSQELLPTHPLNKERAREGRDMASSIWPWGGGYRPQMTPLAETFPNLVHRGAVITAVDLIRGIGRYAGLEVINVPGATGLFDTNFEGKAQAAIDAFRQGCDFVYLHVEASDEAGHDGSVPLKLQTIQDLDHRLIRPILDAFEVERLKPEAEAQHAQLAIALLPDHPTPCAHRTHTAEPIPFCIWYPGIEPDGVQTFDEVAARQGSYGLLEGDEFIRLFMSTPHTDTTPLNQ